MSSHEFFSNTFTLWTLFISSMIPELNLFLHVAATQGPRTCVMQNSMTPAEWSQPKITKITQITKCSVVEIQSYSCKTKTQRSLPPTIPWNWAKCVKIFTGIIARLHHTDQKQMGHRSATIQRKKWDCLESGAQSERSSLLYCCN